MGWGTFYKTTIKINKCSKDFEKIVNENNKTMNLLWDDLLAAVAMNPIIGEDAFEWPNKCQKYVNSIREKIESMIKENRIISEYFETVEEHKDNIIKDDESGVEFLYDGYLSHIGRYDSQDNLETNNDIIRDYWGEIIAAVAMTPTNTVTDVEDNVFSWNEWCVSLIRERRRYIEEYVIENVGYSQCLIAEDEFPDSVKEC